MLTALVIDDSEAFAESVVRLLEMLNVESRMAFNVRQAMVLLLKEPPDIIFLDIKMPGFDGFEVLSYLRREPKLAEVPVCIISNDDQREVVARSKKLGAIGFIVKPPTLEGLKMAVQKAARIKDQA